MWAGWQQRAQGAAACTAGNRACSSKTKRNNAGGSEVCGLRSGSARGRIFYPDSVAGAAPEGGPCQRSRRRGWAVGPSAPPEPVVGFTRPEPRPGVHTVAASGVFSFFSISGPFLSATAAGCLWRLLGAQEALRGRFSFPDYPARCAHRTEFRTAPVRRACAACPHCAPQSKRVAAPASLVLRFRPTSGSASGGDTRRERTRHAPTVHAARGLILRGREPCRGL